MYGCLVVTQRVALLLTLFKFSKGYPFSFEKGFSLNKTTKSFCCLKRGIPVVRKESPFIIKFIVFSFSGGEGIIYVEATKPGKVTLIGLYLETKCIEELTISVIYKEESGLEEDNFLVSVKMLLFCDESKNSK